MAPAYRYSNQQTNMTKNQYDIFADSWISNRQKKDRWNLAINFVEKPAMFKMLGDVHDKSVLCLGCGDGTECDQIRKLGAKKVIGIDISSKLIQSAKKNYPRCEFAVCDIEELDFVDKSVDIVYASLTIHYLSNWKKMFSRISHVLKENGMLLFSLPHPVKWSAETKRNDDKGRASFILGYSNDKLLGKYHIYGDYLNLRRVTDVWFQISPRVSFFVRSLSSTFRQISQSGFEVLDFLEPKAIPKTKKINPIYWEIRNKIPLFSIFKVRKRRPYESHS